jgi:hypothetical protein
MTDKIAASQNIGNRQIAPQEPYRKVEKESREKLPIPQDLVQIDHAPPKGVYGKLAGVEIGSPYQLLRQLVIKTLEDQGVASKITTDAGEIDLGSLTPEAAQELISEDGYFGVEKTSQRIVDFAINAFGADPTKLTQIKDAIEKGFQDAAAVFGGQLPEISHQTYAAVMEKLDAFAGVSAEKQQ